MESASQTPHQRASWVVAELSARRVVEGIGLAVRYGARNLAHNLDNFPHDVGSVAAGGAAEQVLDRSAERHLSILAAGKIPIAFV